MHWFRLSLAGSAGTLGDSHSIILTGLAELGQFHQRPGKSSAAFALAALRLDEEFRPLGIRSSASGLYSGPTITVYRLDGLQSSNPFP